MKRSIVYAQLLFLVLLPVWLKLTSYLHPLVIVVIWFTLIIFVVSVTCWWKQEKVILPIQVLHTAAILYTCCLLVLLFFRPKNQNYDTINLVPFDTILFYLSGNVDFLIAFYNLAANIVLFIPFGLYYGFWKQTHTTKQVLFISTCAITIIELMQFINKRGSLDIDDLLLNVLGVWCGFLLYPQIKKILIIKNPAGTC